MKKFLIVVALLIGLAVVFEGFDVLKIAVLLLFGLIGLVLALGGAALALKSLKDLIE